MANFSRGDVVLVRYPFSDLSSTKVRPAVVLTGAGSRYNDVFVVPLTSRTKDLSEKEFALANWRESGLNVPSAVKRGLLLIETSVILKMVGQLSRGDLDELVLSVRHWLALE